MKNKIDISEYPYINRGLEGIVAFTTQKSFIDGKQGKLIYCGYSIDVLAESSSFEEVCFLLWNERLPTKNELIELKRKFRSQRNLPDTVIKYITSTAKDSEPMAVLRTAVSMLADFDQRGKSFDSKHWIDQSIALVAKVPLIIAYYDRYRSGLDIVPPLEEGSLAENFLYILNGKRPGRQAIATMDKCLILHAEHGINASTFVCRSVCSTQADIYAALAGAIGSLKGPLHGGANIEVINMLLDIQNKSYANPIDYVKEKLQRKEKIMGFGHRVYKTVDPRAVVLKSMSQKLSEETGHIKLYEWSEAILNYMKEEKNIDPNVDFFSATVYYASGIKPDLYTSIFALSRMSGWTAHYIEQGLNNRLIRPRGLYTGEMALPWTPIEDR